MLSVHERIQGMVDILIDSNAELELSSANEAGFVAVPPELLMESVLKILEHTDTKNVSLDLGCGNGGWMLIAAAAGFPSFGIELSPLLVEHAQRNYELGIANGFIDPTTPCACIIGDMIPLRFNATYMAFRKLHEKQEKSMPIGAVSEDAYARLPTSIATADIIYCWSWPTQSRFLFDMLEDEAKSSVLFILPSYERYITAEYHDETFIPTRLLLTPLSNAQSVYVGRRT